MVRIRYEPDEAGVAELMNTPEVVALMREAAEFGQGFAEGISPVSDRKHQHYKDSFEVSAHAHGGPHGDRAEAILANTADYAADVEYRNHGGEHILARTADAIEARYNDA